MSNFYHCTFLGMIMIFGLCVQATNDRFPSKAKRLESFTSRYTLPTNDRSLIARLPFTFGYRFTDDYGTTQSREEKTDPNGAKTGSYSFIDPSGIYRRVDYIADHLGFRATVRTNEPGTIPADPAHVRVRIDNQSHNPPPRYNPPLQNSPQLEYSSHIFSRYNFSSNHPPEYDHFVETPRHNLRGVEQNSLFNGDAIFDAERTSPRKPLPPFKLPFNDDLNINPVRIPRKPQIIPYNFPKNHIDSAPIKPDLYFDAPNVNQEYVFGDKLANIGYNTPTYSLIRPDFAPTRYPRRLRNPRPRPKNSPQYEIHIPRGYESHPGLPLYRDK